MRTDAEELDFARECERIEKNGGDVQGYIAQEYPSYTPRAVWYRLQRNYLGRKDFQLTEGRPKKKGVKYMGKMMELAQGCLDAYGRGETVFDYLKSQGSKNPSAYWYQIKQTAKLKDPDLYEQLSVIRTGDKKKPQESETVSFGGKEYEKYEPPKEIVQVKGKDGRIENVKLYGDKPSPTCCQPARPSGVTVPDQLPDNLPICAVKSNVAGKWELARTDGFVHLIYQETQCLTLHADKWMELAQEIPRMLKQLGL